MLGRAYLFSKFFKSQRFLSRASLNNFILPYQWFKIKQPLVDDILSQLEKQQKQKEEFKKQRNGNNRLRSSAILALMGAGILGPSILNQSDYFAPRDANCANYDDSNLQKALKELDRGMREIKLKYPNAKIPVISSGLRGTRYYIQFPIASKNIDYNQLIDTIRTMVRTNNDFKDLGQQSMKQTDSRSYKIDYKVTSESANGASHNGTFYLRGIIGSNYDSFKISVEKDVQISQNDIDVLLAIFQQISKPKNDQINMGMGKVSKKKSNSNSSNKSGAGKNKSSGLNPFSQQQQSQQNQDPHTALEDFGCSVFIPGNKKDALTWDYLAGYDTVKRDIEDTVLLALQNGSVYDQITQSTRMKNQTNRPKCVLFQGPPGCGKTTSAKIIAQQVNIPLVYMPLQAIMSKYYGESESRLANIFEACQALGRVILFIDQIDSLATSRQTGVHQATRRILSTLLRKIDSFESDGEVLVICATNRKKDLDPALVSRLDLSVRFQLPDAQTRAKIFQRYAKQLKQEELRKLGQMTNLLSGRDISDICKDAERRWASKFIRKEVSDIVPQFEVYLQCAGARQQQMGDVNLRMDRSIPENI